MKMSKTTLNDLQQSHKYEDWEHHKDVSVIDDVTCDVNDVDYCIVRYEDGSFLSSWLYQRTKGRDDRCYVYVSVTGLWLSQNGLLLSEPRLMANFETSDSDIRGKHERYTSQACGWQQSHNNL